MTDESEPATHISRLPALLSRARFANVMDRLMPLMHNFFSEGEMWQKKNVSYEQIIERGLPMADGSTQLWAAAQAIIEEAIHRGYLAR